MASNRLSPENITDVLLRGELYREIRKAQEGTAPTGWRIYEVQPADISMPEKIAWKVYGLDTLKWVVMLAASLDDSREYLEAGTVLRLPPSAWIRERIKHYTAMQSQGVRE